MSWCNMIRLLAYYFRITYCPRKTLFPIQVHTHQQLCVWGSFVSLAIILNCRITFCGQTVVLHHYPSQCSIVAALASVARS